MVKKTDLLDNKPIPYLEKRIANLTLVGPLFDFNCIRSTLKTLHVIHRHGVIGVSFLHDNRSNLYLNPIKTLDTLYQKVLVFILSQYEDLLQNRRKRNRQNGDYNMNLHNSPCFTDNPPYGFSLQYLINTPVQFHSSRTKVPEVFEFQSRSQIVLDIDTKVDPFVDQLFRELNDKYGQQSVELRSSGTGYHIILYIPTCSIQDSQPLVEGFIRDIANRYEHLDIDAGTIDVHRLVSFPGTPYTKDPDPTKWSTVRILGRPHHIKSSHSFLASSITQESWRSDQCFPMVDMRPRKPKIITPKGMFECEEDFHLYFETIEGFFCKSLYGGIAQGYTIINGPVGPACYRLSGCGGYIGSFQKPSHGLRQLRLQIGQSLLKGIRSDQGLLETPPSSLGLSVDDSYRPLSYDLITIRTMDKRQIKSLGIHWFWFSGHRQGEFFGYCWIDRGVGLDKIKSLHERITLVPNLSFITWQNKLDLLPIPFTPSIDGDKFARFVGSGKVEQAAYQDDWSKNFHRFAEAIDSNSFPSYESVSEQFPILPQESRGGRKRKTKNKSINAADHYSRSFNRQIGTFNGIDDIPLLKEGLPRPGIRCYRVWECVKNLASMGFTREQTIHLMQERLRTLPNASRLFENNPQLFWADVRRVIDKADDFSRKPFRVNVVAATPIEWTIPSVLKLLRRLNYNLKAVAGAMWLIEYVKRNPHLDINTAHTQQLRRMPGSQSTDPITGNAFTPSSFLRYLYRRGIVEIVERGIPKRRSKRLKVVFEMVAGDLLPKNDPNSVLPYLSQEELDKVKGISKRLRQKIERQNGAISK